MVEKMLTKEEASIFGRKKMNKIKRKDFYSYIQYYEAMLESLKNSYDPKKYKNPAIEDDIKDLQEYVDQLNKYYFDVIISKNKPQVKEKIDHMEDEFRSFEKFEENLHKSIELEITREENEIKKMIARKEGPWYKRLFKRKKKAK